MDQLCVQLHLQQLVVCLVSVCGDHSSGPQGQSNKLFRDLGEGEIRSALPETADSVNLVVLGPCQKVSDCGNQGLCGIPLPAYIFQLQEVANLTLLVLLLAMCTQECVEIQTAILDNLSPCFACPIFFCSSKHMVSTLW